MYRAVCASCGKQCEVPFKPSGDRPIYCRDCFRTRNEGSGGGGAAPKRGGGSGKPFTPRPSSPQGTGQQSSALAAQLTAINGKLDRLLALLEGETPRLAKSPRPAKKSVAKRRVKK
jgi:CxxC-x17-CxxC domain-containing protein